MLAEPDWTQPQCRETLNRVLKWEIYNLLQRLSETGEESVVLTANVGENRACTLASLQGSPFLEASEGRCLPSQFLTFCRGFTAEGDCSDGPDGPDGFGDNGPYRDLVSGEIVQGPVTGRGPDIGQTSSYQTGPSYRKSTHRPQSVAKKIKHEPQPGLSGSLQHHAEPSHPGAAGSLPSMPSGVNGVTDTGTTDVTETPQSVVKKERKTKSSKRKRTPKKVVPFYHKDTCSDSTEPGGQTADSDTDIEGSDSVPPLWGIRAEHNSHVIQEEKSISSSFNKSRNKVKRMKNGIKDNDGSEFSCDTAMMNGRSPPTEAVDDVGNLSSATDIRATMTGSNSASDSDIPMITLTSDADHWPGTAATVVGPDGTMKIVSVDLQLALAEGKEGPRVSQRRVGAGFKAAGVDEDPGTTVLLDQSRRGVRQYECPYCQLLVRDRHDLKRHLRTHTKEKPYPCPLCDRRFARRWDLINHLRRNHDDVSSSFDLESYTKQLACDTDPPVVKDCSFTDNFAKHFQYDTDSVIVKDESYADLDVGADDVQQKVENSVYINAGNQAGIHSDQSVFGNYNQSVDDGSQSNRVLNSDDNIAGTRHKQTGYVFQKMVSLLTKDKGIGGQTGHQDNRDVKQEAASRKQVRVKRESS